MKDEDIRRVINEEHGFEVAFDCRADEVYFLSLKVSDRWLDQGGLGPTSESVVALVEAVEKVCAGGGGRCAVVECATPEDRVVKSYFNGNPASAFIETCNFHRGWFEGWTTVAAAKVAEEWDREHRTQR